MIKVNYALSHVVGTRWNTLSPQLVILGIVSVVLLGPIGCFWKLNKNYKIRNPVEILDILTHKGAPLICQVPVSQLIDNAAIHRHPQLCVILCAQTGQEPGHRAGSTVWSLVWSDVHTSADHCSPSSVGCCPTICRRHWTLTDPQSPGNQSTLGQCHPGLHLRRRTWH